MMALFLCLVASFTTLILTLLLVPKFVLNSLIDFIFAGLVLCLLNFITAPMLLRMGARIKISTLGFFSFIFNLLLLNMSTGLIDEFSFESLNASIFAAGLMAFFQAWLVTMDGERKKLTRP